MSQETKIKRQVQFFKAILIDPKTNMEVAFDAPKAWRHIQQLKPKERMFGFKKYSLYSINDARQGGFHCLRLCKLKKDDLTEIGNDNCDEPRLLPLQDSEGTVDTSHIVFFPKNIIGMSYSSGTPSRYDLETYLQRRTLPNYKKIKVAKLMYIDAARQLEQVDEVTQFTIKANNAFVESITKDETKQFFSGITESKVFDELIFELKISRPNRGTFWGEKIINLIKELANQPADPASLRVSGRKDKGKVKSFDLMRHMIKKEMKFPRQDKRHRSIDHLEAYQVIANAYADVKTEIDRAAVLFNFNLIDETSQQ